MATQKQRPPAHVTDAEVGRFRLACSKAGRFETVGIGCSKPEHTSGMFLAADLMNAEPISNKLADIIAIDLSDPFIQPVYDPASHLVYSNHGRAVTHSWINGVPQVQDGKLTRIDVPDLMLRVEEWAGKIREQQTV